MKLSGPKRFGFQLAHKVCLLVCLDRHYDIMEGHRDEHGLRR
jgi:hypothetical protein